MDQDKVKKPIFPTKEKQTSKLNTDFLSKITKSIGTGNNAINSITYQTIKWSFLIGGFLSILVSVNCWWFNTEDAKTVFVDGLESVWGVVIPIITLTLGYTLGKNETVIKKQK
jgi:Na+-driven multidrug efflux pump